MEIMGKDRAVLRRLAGEQAEIAALPCHRKTIEGWRRINDLQSTKPMVWINEIPWHEMDVNDELRLATSSDFWRGHEQTLRRTIYQWRHMPADMVVDPVFYCPKVVADSGLGIDEDVEVATTDVTSDIYSRRFHPQIQSEADIAKIKTPLVTFDAAATEEQFQALNDAFGDLLPVQSIGFSRLWFAPWDLLIRWWGVQEAMSDLIERPELVHHAMERLVSAFLARLDQYEVQGLLDLNCNNVRVGSGGLGYTSDLPPRDFDPAHVRPADLWGSAAAQIFSAVSPRMHEEFALQHELRWLSRFGLTYYGCCDPLDTKMEMLHQVRNLRKVSVSPWVDLERAIKNIGDRYVFSWKPSPAIFAEDDWNPSEARRMLLQTLEKTRGCIVEVIMKDVSTVRYQPQRLWEWAAIASEVTADFA